MTLQSRLDKIRNGFEEKAPPQVLAVMHRVTETLKAPEIMSRVVGEDMVAPDFTLEDSHGARVSLAALRSRGTVLLTFFRCDW